MSTLLRRGCFAAALATLVAALCCGRAVAVHGPDVSQWQHPNGYNINWTSAHLSHGQASFAFVKATEGTSYTNPYFASDFRAIAANHMVRGAYHFARPGTGSAAAQARYFVSRAGTLHRHGDLPPVLDLEVSGGLSVRRLVAWTSSWLKTVRNLTGRRAIIYSYPGFWLSAMGNTHAFTGYPLWIATFGPHPELVGGWSHYTFWQYTDRAKVAGISTPVDMSRFNGHLARLWSLANGAPVPAAPQSLHASVRGSTATVSWSQADVGVPIHHWAARVDDGPVSRQPASHRFFTVRGLTPGTHRISVAARNSTGESRFSRVLATVSAPRA